MRKSQIAVLLLAVILAGFFGTYIRQRRGMINNRNVQLQKSVDYDNHATDSEEVVFSVVDSSLIGYIPIDTLLLRIKEPYGIACDNNDRCYITSSDGIYRLDEKFHVDSTITLPDTVLTLCFDPDNRMYAATRKKVFRFTEDGSSYVTWTVGTEKSYITSIATDEKCLYIADAGMRLVWRYDTSGNKLNAIGERDTIRNIPGIIVPSPSMDCAIGQDGSLWVVNPGRHRIENYRSNGDLVFSWGKAGTDIEKFCGCCNPIHMVIMPNGSFLTAEKGIVRVKEYGPTGVFTTVVAPPHAFPNKTTHIAIAVNSEEKVFILDSATKVVLVFSRKETSRGKG
jgi:hypothetical protein